MFSKLSKTFSFFSLMKRVVLTSTQALWMQHFNALLEYRPEAGAQLSSLLSLQPWSVKTCLLLANRSRPEIWRQGRPSARPRQGGCLS